MKWVKLNPFFTSKYLTRGKSYYVLKETQDTYELLDDDEDKSWFGKRMFDVVEDDIYNEIGFLKDKIAYLEENNTKFCNGVIDFGRENRNLRKENKRLHNKNEELEEKIKYFRKYPNNLIDSIVTFKDRIEELEEELEYYKQYDKEIKQINEGANIY